MNVMMDITLNTILIMEWEELIEMLVFNHKLIMMLIVIHLTLKTINVILVKMVSQKIMMENVKN